MFFSSIQKSPIPSPSQVSPSGPEYLSDNHRIIDPAYSLRRRRNNQPVLPYQDEEGNIHDPFYRPFPSLGPARAKRSGQRVPYFETFKLPEPELLPEIDEALLLSIRRKGRNEQFPRSAYDDGPRSPSSPRSRRSSLAGNQSGERLVLLSVLSRLPLTDPSRGQPVTALPQVALSAEQPNPITGAAPLPRLMVTPPVEDDSASWLGCHNTLLFDTK